MKKYIKIALISLAICPFASCIAPAQKVMDSTNQKVKVELLFEIDGCKVYRFYDGGAVRYFSKCNSSSSIGWMESCGKGCQQYVDIQTSYTK